MKAKKRFQAFKRNFIEQVRRFHLRFGWKPRRAKIGALHVFEIELQDVAENNSYELMREYGPGGSEMRRALWQNIFSYYFD